MNYDKKSHGRLEVNVQSKENTRYFDKFRFVLIHLQYDYKEMKSGFKRDKPQEDMRDDHIADYH